MKELIAKTFSKGYNRTLENHTKMVLNIGVYCAENTIKDVKNLMQEDKDLFKKYVALSCILHDIGKSTSTLQTFYKKVNTSLTDDGTENKGIQHNVYSWAFSNIIKSFNTQPKYQEIVGNAILYHHVVTEENTKYNNKYFLRFLQEDEDVLDKMKQFYLMMLDYCENTFNITFNENDRTFIENFEEDIRAYDLPSTWYNKITHFTPKEWQISSFQDMCRAILIYADRTVSNERNNTELFLNNDINYFDYLTNKTISNDTKQVYEIKWEETFNNVDYKRLDEQLNAVNVITNNDNVKLFANAGFGKTLIGLLWVLNSRKKTVWVVPRNIIACNTYNRLEEDMRKLGINNMKIALILGGEVVKKNFVTADDVTDVDIIITNIDSILNTQIKNATSKYMYDVYSTNLIFDEYHEFVCNEQLFPMFIKLMMSRVRYTTSKTILMSATPIDFSVFGLKDELHIHECEKHNGNMEVQINVYDELDVNNIKNDSFIITHTIQQAQNVYISIPNEDKDIIHSNYTEEDRTNHTETLYNKHNKHSNINERNIVVSTNIIGVGLDVSAKHIYDYIVGPESTIQRCCGRGGRFGEKEYNNQIEYNVITSQDNSSKFFIKNTYHENLTDKWKDKLISLNGTTITKADIYEIYNDFVTDNKGIYDEYYKQCFLEAQENMIKPYKSSKKSTKKDDVKYISNNTNSIRNSSSKNVFVIAKTNEGKWSDVINIDIQTLERKETNDGNNINKRKEFMKLNKDERFEYKNLKYRINNDFTIDSLTRIATSSKSPIPLFNFSYSKQIGLYFNEK